MWASQKTEWIHAAWTMREGRWILPSTNSPITSVQVDPSQN